MAKPSKRHRKSKPEPSSVPARGLPREAKIAMLAALPFGVFVALLMSWEQMFPVPPEQLVEVAWKHECACAHNWMKSLRAEQFTVRDYELEDTSTQRRKWQVPDSIRGCHPASYLGYFLDGHIRADTLRRLARERPQAIGLQQVDTTKPREDGVVEVTSSQLLLIRHDGTATPWLPEKMGGAPH